MNRASIAGVLLAVASISACGGSSSPSSPTTPGYVIPAADLADMLSEKVMGSPSAAVTIVEYSSLTCPHCATFHASTLPQIKAAYLDTGKVRFVYRDFPVPGAASTAAAFAAAGLARCAGSSRYFEALDLLYRAQASWTSAGSVNSAMKQAVAPLGMASDRMDACMASADVQNEINRVMAEGWSAYGISGTPTFVVNGQKLVGALSFAEFDAVLKTLVK